MPSLTPLLGEASERRWSTQPAQLPAGRLPKVTALDPAPEATSKSLRQRPKSRSANDWGADLTSTRIRSALLSATPPAPSPADSADIIARISQPGGASSVLREVFAPSSRGPSVSLGFSRGCTMMLEATPIDASRPLGGGRAATSLTENAEARSVFLHAQDSLRLSRSAPAAAAATLNHNSGNGNHNNTTALAEPASLRALGVFEGAVRRVPASPAAVARAESRLGIKGIDAVTSSTATRPAIPAASLAVAAEVALQRGMQFTQDVQTRRSAAEWASPSSLLPITHAGAGFSGGDAGSDEMDVAKRLRVALAALVMEQYDAHGLLPPALSLARGELMNALYVAHKVPTTVTDAQPSSVRPTASGGGDAATASSFFDLETYADAYHLLARSIRLPRAALLARAQRDAMTHQAAVRGGLRLANRVVLGLSFRAWRQVTRANPTRLAEKFLGMATKQNDVILLRTYMTKWVSWFTLRQSSGVFGVDIDASGSISIAGNGGATRLLSLARQAKRQNASDERDKAQLDLLQHQVQMLEQALLQFVPGPQSDAFLRALQARRMSAGLAVGAALSSGTGGGGGAGSDSLSAAAPLVHTQSMLRDLALDAGDDAIMQSKRALDEIMRLRGADLAFGSAVSTSGADDAPLQVVEKIAIPDMLLLWVNQLLDISGFSGALHLRAVSLDMSFADGRVFCAIGANLYPEHSLESLMPVEPTTRRLDRILETLRTIGCFALPEFVTTADVASGGVGTIVLLVHLWRQWYHANLSEMHAPRYLESGVDASEEIASTRLLYTFAASVKLNRMLARGMEVLYSRTVEWVEAQMMAKLRSATADSGGGSVDLHDFTKCEPSYFGDAEHLCADGHAECHKVAIVLKNHYTELKRIFEFYRAASASKATDAVAGPAAPGAGKRGAPGSLTPPPSSASTPVALNLSSQRASPTVPYVSPKEVIRFLEDTRLLHKPNTSRQTLLAFFDVLLLRQLRVDIDDEETAMAVFKNECAAGAHVSAGGLPHGSLYITKAIFIEIIVRICATTLCGTTRRLELGAIATVLDTIVTSDIVSRAMSSAKLDFKRLIGDPRVQDVLNSGAVSKFLSQVYRHYSTLDHTTGKPTMVRGQFLSMLAELRLIDKVMTREAVMSIFTDVQDDETFGGDEVGETMSLSEFGEAVVAIAMFKIPHPLKSVHQRLNQFLEQTMIPVCKSHFLAGRGVAAAGGAGAGAAGQADRGRRR